MVTDFERELSELLHTLTPQPPDHLAPPDTATLGGPPVAAGATVIELVPATAPAPRRAHRWWVGIAATAAAVLTAGGLALSRDGHTGQPSAGLPPASPSPRATPVAQCPEDDLVLQDGRRFAARGGTGTTQFSFRNTGARSCALLDLEVALTVQTGTAAKGGWTFAVSSEPVTIPARGRVDFTVHLRVTGRCHAVANGGVIINITQNGTTGSMPIGTAGCTVTPRTLTHRIVP